MQSVAQGWLVYRISDDPFALGLVAFAGYVPILLLSPVAGVVADRFERRKVLIFSSTLRGVSVAILGLLAVTESVELWQIFVMSAFFGIFTIVVILQKVFGLKVGWL